MHYKKGGKNESLEHMHSTGFEAIIGTLYLQKDYERLKIIFDRYKKYVSETDDHLPTVIASTASPYKFTRSVMEALGADTDGKDDFALADELSALSGVKLPQAVETIRTAPVLHNRVVDAPDMPKAVKDILGIR